MATRIMIVDDEPAIGRLLVYQLRGAGYEATYVQDGLLALERFMREQPDLVLLDVMMPQISGWEVCRQIRACSTVPVMMLTAKGADPDIAAGLEAGADDHITKPFSMVQLLARVEAVLRRSERTPGAAARMRARLDPHLTGLATPYGAAARPPATAPLPPAPAPPAPDRRLGQRMRAARIARGLSLHEVEHECKIRWEFLQAIEQENWSYVPRPQLRLALNTYTSYLGLDLRELIGRPAPARPRPLFPMQLLAAMALVVVLIVVGLYLL